ncbi:hypothetical protein CABS01_06671 [Colletotrichum abscissum]|uniref:Uncharacterized protein n=1 Tax=Colletotrichum lupini TaxID=145971 RepID=A0A9Q8SAJ1_9PEZI|nr:uncharacterized protein CLUP02_00208 [Colletotrichum lupini]XP_060403720.1 uncharacterized protein CABS01_06671 [Colletotrichum abscissum]KAK1514692.1 hypothetical protein CABS01_06671 [Colletotrichum abscissum]UQC73563.1 hypothetical protein CLUP02_00208 [Colletotrichum lupini]
MRVRAHASRDTIRLSITIISFNFRMFLRRFPPGYEER